jgi:hypothetical protein
MRRAVWCRCTIAGLYRRRGGAENQVVSDYQCILMCLELTATTMAGFAATLAGTEMYIWMLDGLVPKPVTC